MKRFFFFFILSNAGLGASEGTINDHLLYHIMENEHICVDRYMDEKIYLSEDRLVNIEGKLMLDIEGDKFSLPVVQFNELGSYLTYGLTSELYAQGANIKGSKGPCPACGVATTKYGKCMNRKCDFYTLLVL